MLDVVGKVERMHQTELENRRLVVVVVVSQAYHRMKGRLVDWTF